MMIHGVRFSDAIEYRLLTLAVAVWTQPMRWFSASYRFFKGVGDDSAFYLVQFVALRLSLPCFKASNFFFQFVFALNQRRILLKQRELSRLCFGKQGLQLIDLGDAVRLNFEFKKRLDDLVRLTKGRCG